MPPRLPRVCLLFVSYCIACSIVFFEAVSSYLLCLWPEYSLRRTDDANVEHQHVPSLLLPSPPFFWQALRVRARKETLDRDGNKRVTGEEWLVVRVGAYLPGAYEEVLDTVNAIVLTDKVALHMRAIRTFTDTFGKLRKTGMSSLNANQAGPACVL